MNIVDNPINFRNVFLQQSPNKEFDDHFKSVLNVLLYYIWRGFFKSRTAILNSTVQPDLGFLCLSAYKALLPILYSIRLGYLTDVYILLRAHMERIALIGYLDENRIFITKYKNRVGNLQKKALNWAKQESLENWMFIYGRLSDVAHSKLEGTVGHLLDFTFIGEAFRKNLQFTQDSIIDSSHEILYLICYSLIALDTIVSKVLNDPAMKKIPEDRAILKYVQKNDLINLYHFLSKGSK
jgi:hypothetical protein